VQCNREANRGVPSAGAASPSRIARRVLTSHTSAPRLSNVTLAITARDVDE